MTSLATVDAVENAPIADWPHGLPRLSSAITRQVYFEPGHRAVRKVNCLASAVTIGVRCPARSRTNRYVDALAVADHWNSAPSGVSTLDSLAGESNSIPPLPTVPLPNPFTQSKPKTTKNAPITSLSLFAGQTTGNQSLGILARCVGPIASCKLQVFEKTSNSASCSFGTTSPASVSRFPPQVAMQL